MTEPDRPHVLIAVGARPEPVYRHAVTFGAEGAPSRSPGSCPTSRSVAWSLPLYEPAIMTARDVFSAGIDGVRLTFVTPESRPLEAFGPEASAMVAEMLAPYPMGREEAERLAHGPEGGHAIERGLEILGRGG